MDMAHVFVHDPLMVIINRSKNNGIWSVSVEELYDDDVEGSKIIPVYRVVFKDEEINTAIELFLSLIKSQRKDFEKYMYKKLGKIIILRRPKVPEDCDTQNYLYETLRNDIRHRSSRRRRGSAT
jgi:glutathione peroxidase-family protein